MELTKIELTGFKSFAKKTTFKIDSPVTGIVGPNGSGKSNVAEAFRFVLGEQSVKSMRGKTGADLIFKGSKGLSQMSRASVLLTFKNEPKEDSASPYASFSEIVLGREIFADGTNEYSINGSKVRLKDIQELLAHNNIGSSHHHIISQGEADRVLHASVKDRKEMVQDALGLRIYEWRLKESEKKLLSVLENMREAQISRREIAPHVQFLKKQIDKVQKGTQLRSELAGLYHSYLAQESAYINQLQASEPEALDGLKSALANMEKEIVFHQSKKTTHLPDEITAKVVRVEDLIEKAEKEKNEVVKSVISLETELRILENSILKTKERESEILKVSAEGTVSKKEATEFSKSVQDIHEKLVWRFEHKEFQELPALFNILKARLQSFDAFLNHAAHTQEVVHTIDTKELEDSVRRIKEDLEKAVLLQSQVATTLEDLYQKRREIHQERDTYKEGLFTDERKVFELEKTQAELKGKLSLLELKMVQLNERKERFDAELAEAVVLIGDSVLQYKNEPLTDFDPHAQDDVRRKIERLKLKIEDIGVVNVAEVTREYESVSGRDEFLANEIRDLEESKTKLELLMEDLRKTLATEFESGLNAINTHFQKFFSTMFGGGQAHLILTEREKRQKRSSDEEMEDDAKEMETGIDVAISLPHKKVKDIGMLSGGERALTSIALLFALSQVNPPPFLILDETDAALDESNAKKYGAVLNELSEHSKLIVITHNRETMARTHALYGVTLDVDGSSRILSVKLDEANAYAK